MRTRFFAVCQDVNSSSPSEAFRRRPGSFTRCCFAHFSRATPTRAEIQSTPKYTPKLSVPTKDNNVLRASFLRTNVGAVGVGVGVLVAELQRRPVLRHATKYGNQCTSRTRGRVARHDACTLARRLESKSTTAPPSPRPRPFTFFPRTPKQSMQ